MNKPIWSVKRCRPGDESTIIELAETVWKPTFSEILSPERLEYLFSMMYDKNILAEQIANPAHLFYILRLNETNSGYAQLVISRDFAKVEKLYVLPNVQGKGGGLYLLSKIRQEAVDKQKCILRLQVNRANDKAIAFYLKYGFEIVRSEDFDVGGGHMMDDYVMEFSTSE